MLFDTLLQFITVLWFITVQMFERIQKGYPDIWTFFFSFLFTFFSVHSHSLFPTYYNNYPVRVSLELFSTRTVPALRRPHAALDSLHACFIAPVSRCGPSWEASLERPSAN